MKKLLFVLALFSSPAIAQEDIVAKADRELADMKSRIAQENPALAKLMADHEATKRANAIKNEQVMAQTQATIDTLNKQVAEHEKEYGPSRYRPRFYYPGMYWIYTRSY